MNKEKNKITKLKLFLDLDKELDYINEMNKEGWKLVYIKGGFLYTFVKTQPDEYFTVTYTVAKEEVSRITTFAAQCGYESIPHTMDGFGDMLYLTGKKNEVSQEFVNDSDSKISSFSKIHNKYFVISIIYTLLTVLLLLETIFFWKISFNSGFETVITFLTIFLTTFSLLYVILNILVFLITHRYKKKINILEAEATIYE